MNVNDPHERKRERALQAVREAAERERMHLANLLESESGRWLLGRLVASFEAEIARKPTGHNSEDSYRGGVRDAAREYRDMIIRHFGHGKIDVLLKGNT